MNIAISAFLILSLICAYNYLGKAKISTIKWKSVKVTGLMLMPFIAIASSPIIVLLAGLHFNQQGYADPKCGMADLGFTFLC